MANLDVDLPGGPPFLSTTPTSTRFAPQYTLGLVFIVSVAIIWAASSVLVQYIYCDLSFDSPFVLTFISTSLFIIYLPLYRFQQKFKICTSSSSSSSSPSTILYHDVSTAQDNSSVDDDDAFDDDDQFSANSTTPLNAPPPMLTKSEHFKIACYLAPLWFIANFLYYVSLSMTSVTSSTIMATTGSLFTFAFSLCFASEKFKLSKFLGVLSCFLGSVIVGISDTKSSNPLDHDENGTSDIPNKCGAWIEPSEVPVRSMLGDFVGLMGAAGYGAYTVLLRCKVPSDDQISMQLLFGYVGLVNVCAISPILLLLWGGGALDLGGLGWTVFGMLVLNGMFNDVLSDYLWARSVVLTSPTVATVGLGLTIPFAFMSDLVVNSITPSLLEVFGALMVIAGFLLVNA